MAEKHCRLLVIDSNASWTRSLFAAMPPEVEVFSLRVQSAGLGTSATLAAVGKTFRKTRLGPNKWEETRIIPGWTKAHKLSSAIVGRWVRRRAAGGPPGRTWAIYTIPQYAAIAGKARGLQQAYYAYDSYSGYGWDQDRVSSWEGRLLQACDKSLAISRTLQQDFECRSGKPVGYLPNAVAGSFIAAVATESMRPADLPTVADGLVVGCIGQMNRSYDWDMIEDLSRLRPADLLVFIGPIIEPDAAMRMRIDAVCRLPNVRWLGPRDHGNLPKYLRWFDVCFNPLAVTDFNNRRSPLRLYDYLATTKPILTSAVAEALTHAPHVLTGRSAGEMAAILDRVRRGNYHPDLVARRAYIEANTWERRAAQLLAFLGGG